MSTETELQALLRSARATEAALQKILREASAVLTPTKLLALETRLNATVSSAQATLTALRRTISGLLPIGAENLADDSVGTAQLQALCVTTAKLGADCVNSSKVADLAIGTEHLQDLCVTNAKRANMAEATFSGRASGAGTGSPQDLSASQARTILQDGWATLRVVSDGIATGVSGIGLTLENSTTATSLVPDQYSPLFAMLGRSYDTDDNTSRTVGAAWQFFGQSSPTPAVNLRLLINSGTGSGWVTANIVLGSSRIAIGATPSASGTVRLEHGASIRYRNFDNDSNLDLVSVGTVNGVNDVAVFGNNSKKSLIRGIPMAKATQTNAQALTAATPTAITFDGTDEFDNDTMHDPSSNSSRMTVKTAGRWRFTWNVKLANNATLRTVLREGGSTEKSHGTICDNVAAYHAASSGSFEGVFTVNQYLEVIATSGSSLNTTPTLCNFSAVWLGDS